MLSQILVAIVTFTITNMDDLLILSIYFANPDYKTRHIVAGQYLGILSLIVVSFVGVILGAILADHWISFLGVVPFALGIKGLFQLRENERDEEEVSSNNNTHKHQYLSVALVTIANGGDNIGVYAPLFANLTFSDIILYMIIFLLLTAVWCALAYYLTSHPGVKRVFEKHGKVILPCFLILLGLFIMKDFGIWILTIL
ncbi:MAG: transporter [Cyclobacteriaceae bacterium]|nr:transporter [Cyclobacteriaceae bacterium]